VSADASTVAVRCEAVTKRVGERALVDGVTLRLQRGEIVGLVGENGAGKTTLMRLILGLRRTTSGTIEVLGDAPPLRPETSARIGAIVEEPAFYPWMGGIANLWTFAMCGAPVAEGAIEEALGLVGLGEASRQRVKTYSQGMRQRLGIALALLRKPELLILDEPANGLDPPSIRDLRELLLRLKQDGAAILVSSHLLDELSRTCDRVLLMARGAIVAERSGGAIGEGETLEQWFMAATGGAR
jgi:ABC-2 type transport system ATP-binding protein